MDEYSGLFTLGIVNRLEAYEAFLDWYFQNNTTPAKRRIYDSEWGIDLSDLDPDKIIEGECMRCWGEECNGKWWMDEDECYDCERQLDHRTRTKTFVLNF